MRLPNKLSYQRSIDPSEVTFFVNWPDGSTRPLRKKTITVLGMHEGTHSAYKDGGDINESVTPNDLATGNPHDIDYCNIPYNAESVECHFSVTIENKVTVPKTCIDPDVTHTLKELVAAYQQRIGFAYLAEKYLTNIINGAWLWDNQSTNSTTIQVETNKGIFVEAQNVHYKRFEPGWEKRLANWPQLVALFTNALLNERDYLSLEISAHLVYPTNKPLKLSQKCIIHQQRGKGRQYQTTTIGGEESPIFGAYKTGAAIALVDDWYPNAQETLRVNHYGIDKTNGITYRHPDTGLDLFSLLKRSEEFLDLLTNEKPLDEETIKQLHFVMANLIKGGPLQQKGN
ncbi:type I-F CRISPR-associated protein Csy3 [Photobacterium sp. SDRW27]|nr:type I-F CRISPR-associated protein Csy3 [Photobacterium obscurum]